MRLRWPYAAATVMYCAVIFFLSSRPVPDLPDTLSFPGADKCVHAVLFGGLTALLGFGLWRSNPGQCRMHSFGMAAVFSVVYGFTDEWHQLYVPSRGADLWDLAADTAGALVAYALMLRLTRPGGALDRRFAPQGNPDVAPGIIPEAGKAPREY